MLIMITGKKRSGKDTVGDMLVELGCIKARPFAIFKEAFREWFDWDDRHMNGELKEVIDPRWGFSPRTLMQVFGTELMKFDLAKRIPSYSEVVGNRIWAKAFRYWYIKQPPGNYVVCDWRFPEEYEELKDLNPFRIKVESNRCAEVIDTHSSEAHISYLPNDLLVINNGTLEELRDNITSVYKEYINV